MLGELDSYSLPAADKEKLAKIKQAASVPDWETLKRILY
jgi:ribosomal protein L39E